MKKAEKCVAFEAYFNKKMEDPAIRAEFEKLQPEHEILTAMIEAREEQGITQKILAEKSGINQANISKIERGTTSPSIRTLQKLAEAMDMTLEIKFKRRLPAKA